jgi:2-polyprenyl-3-methyl-5-hydroxy-6-metoxy-1,4-benzoquinol methylase
MQNKMTIRNLKGWTQREYKGQITGILSPLIEEIRLKMISRWISGKRILDVGCGSAELLNLLSRDCNYVGIDLVPEIIRKNRVNFPKAEFFCLNIEKENPPLAGKFDSIIIAAILEHLRDPKQVLTKLSSYLADRGLIIITTPKPIANILLKLGSSLHLFSQVAYQEHKKLFSKKDLLRLLDECNLDLVKYKSFCLCMNQLIIARKRNVKHDAMD